MLWNVACRERAALDAAQACGVILLRVPFRKRHGWQHGDVRLLGCVAYAPKIIGVMGTATGCGGGFLRLSLLGGVATLWKPAWSMVHS